MAQEIVGMSLSFCVADIARGKIDEKEVAKIVSATAARTEKDWEDLVNSYCQTYWSDFPAQARKIVDRLRKQGKIEQPRLQGHQAHNIAAGYWVIDGQQTRL